MNDLEGKRALVSGGTSGIGRATRRRPWQRTASMS